MPTSGLPVQPYRYDRYIGILTRMAQRGLIQYPDGPDNPERVLFFNVRRRAGRLVGFDAERLRIDLSRGAVTTTEYADVDANEFCVTAHHYHFQPQEGTGLRSLRICRDEKQGCHVNPDELSNLPYHAFPRYHHMLEIESFNTLLALVLALHYVKIGKYPVDRGNEEEYNAVVRHSRRRIAWQG